MQNYALEHREGLKREKQSETNKAHRYLPLDQEEGSHVHQDQH